MQSVKQFETSAVSFLLFVAICLLLFAFFTALSHLCMLPPICVAVSFSSRPSLSCSPRAAAAVPRRPSAPSSIGTGPSASACPGKETLDERGLPAEVIAAFQAEKAVSGQFPTVTVTEEKLTQDADSAAYSKASIRAVSTLPGYKLIDSRSVTIDGNAVDMHVFSAQPLPEEPERRFYQVSVVGKNRTGYTFTALTPLSIGSGLENEVTTIVKSSTLKEPAAQSSSK